MTQLLALCGSLRRHSLNRAALQAVERLSGERFSVQWARLAALPLFNPDLENDLPEAVSHLLAQLQAADGLVIASPEYAHGISGVLKNALDWMVSSPAFYQKPVMMINTSPRAHHALDSTREILTTMSANITDDACVELALLGKSGGELDDVLMPSESLGLLDDAIAKFLAALAEREEGMSPD